MSVLKKILIILIFCCTLCMTANAVASDHTGDIRTLLAYYLHYQESAETDISRILDRISADDKQLGKMWNTIMETWSYVNTKMETSGTVPDGLATDDSLCIVILGHKLTYTGAITKELTGRLQLALKAAEKYPNAYLLVTGGASSLGNPGATEAGKMYSWLVANGIDKNRIIQENASISSELNALYSERILREKYPQVRQIALITSDYHMPRAYLLFSVQEAVNTYESGESRLNVAACIAFHPLFPDTETLQEQLNGIAQLTGVNRLDLPHPKLTQLVGIDITGDTMYDPGQSLDLGVTAVYEDGYRRDVTKHALIYDCDMDVPGMKLAKIEYIENGIRAESSIQVLVQEPEQVVLDAPVNEIAAETTPVPQPAEDIPQSNALIPLLVAATVLGIGSAYTMYRKQQKKKRRRRRRKINWEE